MLDRPGAEAKKTEVTAYRWKALAQSNFTRSGVAGLGFATGLAG